MSSKIDNCDTARRTFVGLFASVALCETFRPSMDAAQDGELSQPREGIFELGDFTLEKGATLRRAKLAYKTHGRLNRDKSNAILYPTQFAAQHGDIEWPIGPGKALDPSKYFIVVLDQLGNGLS